MNKKRNDEISPYNVFSSSLAIVAALFIAIVSIMYVIYRSWSNKLYLEKWKDYDDCGI